MNQSQQIRFIPYKEGIKIPKNFEYERENRSIVKFFNNSAEDCVKEHISKVFIIHNQESDFIGYIALSLCSVGKEGLRSEKARALYERPAIRIGQLIIDKKFQGKGYGSAALRFVTNIATLIEKFVPCRFLVVDALTEKVKSFYKKNKFEESPNGTLIFDLAPLFKPS